MYVIWYMRYAQNREGKTVTIKITFDYRFETYADCISRIWDEESQNKITIVVSHREGIRDMCEELSWAKIPYCGIARMYFDNQNNKFKFIENSQKFE